MLGVAQWFALIGLVTVGIMFLVEVNRWRAPGSVIGSRQKMLRVGLVVLTETLFVMILFGPSFTAHRDILTDLIYWSICLTLGLGVVVLTLFDLRAVSEQFSKRNRRVVDDFLREIERDGK